MTDTPNTPEPAKPQHDADTDAVVDAAGTEHTEHTEAAAPAAQTETPAAAPAAPTAPAEQAPATQEPASGAGWTAPAAHTAGDPGAQPTVPQPTAAQPTAAQPTVPQPTAAPQHQTQPTQPQPYGQPYGQQQPHYGNGAFGQPAGYGQQPQQPPYAPNAHQQGYAGAPGAGTATAPAKPAKRGSTGLIIATLAIGALVGGIAGAGAGVGIYAATNGGNATIKTVSGPQNITVNDANDASTITAVAAKASPSVVTISVSASSSGGTGSGIVLTSDGYVLTNTHVVTLDGQAANVNVTVTDNDGKIYTAKVVGTDPTTDLAVIKLDKASGLTPISWGDSSKLNVGNTTVAIGAPLGLSGTVTDGIVSALNRSISIASSAAPKDDSNNGGGSQNPFNFDFPGQGGQQQQQQSSGTISLPVIQTDASINPGNSGGALLNSKGELIGVNVAIASAGGSSSDGSQSGSIGVGFAIPSNLAKRISDEIIKNGSASHGLLGASVADASTDSKATTVGALIKSVTGGGAAAGAGLQAGDIVVNLDGTPITDATDLTAQVRAHAAGSKVDVTYIRDGQTKTATVTLGSLPAE
ncbi:trypsin-like peptidase domain-containing protein [Leifsonia sp. 21MFCrub1.1]|uniref:trypsin-like peptidase domain-containing protein n=1 Tax=Leifsonia sp. 21MFCrub1.1 TaxID=1798223 RepID=UPI000892969B|nr:trypsin-like peptidase domain-containing protein [Leifsonia sp. 21MFCrub1.1]SEA92706.1 putative serine protease PepD [Leifsonia sp. 21MFCrub1.1]